MNKIKAKYLNTILQMNIQIIKNVNGNENNCEMFAR